MAIFQKAYQGYDGELSAPLQRMLVIFRYALADVFQSRRFTAFFAICFLPSLILMCVIYAYYNFELLTQLEIPIDEIMSIDGSFFALFMQYPQTIMILFMVVAVGPTMISPDLRNNAMPLYLSRPINKANYIVGKLLVLLVLGSLVSWIPSLMLIFLQAYLAGDGWLGSNLHIPLASVVVSLLWILSLSLLAFAVSACVKWKAVARLFFFGIILLGAVLGEVIEEVFGSWVGYLLNIETAIEVIVASLYAANNLPFESGTQMPLWAAFSVLFAVCGISTAIITQRIRAFQVVS